MTADADFRDFCVDDFCRDGDLARAAHFVALFDEPCVRAVARIFIGDDLARKRCGRRSGRRSRDRD